MEGDENQRAREKVRRDVEVKETGEEEEEEEEVRWRKRQRGRRGAGGGPQISREQNIGAPDSRDSDPPGGQTTRRILRPDVRTRDEETTGVRLKPCLGCRPDR